ncbi:Arylsulfatase [Planctomycetes bacterium Poly30]|uniref:Arylsulfatase n=1 Tax=Saltatorellus ferox TaxID=2528018 RepID=A0A518ETZ6_9BACT|nr:Arylsulfatase [Planctomycetes bacterium Poly30]
MQHRIDRPHRVHLPFACSPAGLLVGCFLGLLTAGCGSKDSNEASTSGGVTLGKKMNVLVVTLDTTRADRLSCYGGKPGLTPTLDALAADGSRFERAISTAGITPMSHSSILTGLNNYKHGMRVFYSDVVSHRLKDSVDTLPEILKANGYKTAARVSSYPVSEEYNLHQGFDSFDAGIATDELDLTEQQRHETSWDQSGKSSTQRRGDFTTDGALEWLDKEGKDGPWCMWLHMFDVHDYSLVPPAEFMKGYGIEYPDPESVRGGAKLLEWREKMYDPELAFMDMQIRRVVQWLEENGQMDNTIIVVTADHGQGLSEGMKNQGWMKHRLLYEWSVHVPLIIRIPGFGAATVVPDQVRTIDIVPTLLEALEVPLRQAIEGESVLDLIRGQRESSPRIAYADALNDYDTHSPGAQKLPVGQADNLYMACDGRWKLIYHERNPRLSELYDLVKDPEEIQNLYAEDHPEAMRLQEFLDEREVTKVELPDGKSSGPSAARLEALGYGGGNDPDRDEKPK